MVHEFVCPSELVLTCYKNLESQMVKCGGFTVIGAKPIPSSPPCSPQIRPLTSTLKSSLQLTYNFRTLYFIR